MRVKMNTTIYKVGVKINPIHNKFKWMFGYYNLLEELMLIK